MASNIHTLPNDLPPLGPFDAYLKRTKPVMNLWRTGYKVAEGEMDAQRNWLAQYEDLKQLRPSLARDLAVLQRKANRTDIVDALLPFNVLPKNKDAPTSIASVLAQRVAAREPTFGAINIAALQVLDTAKWYPTPADLLTALDLANQTLANIGHAIEKIPVWREQVAAALVEGERHQAFESQRRAARIEYARTVQEPKP